MRIDPRCRTGETVGSGAGGQSPHWQARDSVARLHVVPSGRCPTCRQDAGAADPRYRPFCSERCRLLDLSHWASERYRIAGEPVNPAAADPANDDDAS